MFYTEKKIRIKTYLLTDKSMNLSVNVIPNFHNDLILKRESIKVLNILDDLDSFSS